MSGPMNIIQKIFGGMPAQQPASQAQAANPSLQQQQPGTPGNIPQQNMMPANPDNPTVPAELAAPTVKAPEGLDKFNDLWNIKPEDMPKAPESAFSQVTPEAVKAIAAKTDFSKVVTPEMMTAISAGGEGAAAAMIQALNATSQEVYSTAAQASMRLIDTALAKQREQFEASLPGLIKNQNVAENLRTSNPIFNHPAAAPILDLFTKQLQLKNPTADAAVIQAQAQEFLLSFAQVANPPKISASSKVKSTEDWESFL